MHFDLSAEDRAFRDGLREWLAVNWPEDWARVRGRFASQDEQFAFLRAWQFPPPQSRESDSFTPSDASRARKDRPPAARRARSRRPGRATTTRGATPEGARGVARDPCCQRGLASPPVSRSRVSSAGVVEDDPPAPSGVAPRRYSYRRASIGSRLAALRAG